MKTYVFAFLLWCSFSAHAQSCGNESVRQTLGSEPLASKLYVAARGADFGPWRDGSFHSEAADYLGDLRVNGSIVHVVHLQTIWGSACRATNRLLFFSATFKPLGSYSGPGKPSIHGNSLVFSFQGKRQSVVDFSRGLPEQIDGGDDFYAIEREP